MYCAQTPLWCYQWHIFVFGNIFQYVSHAYILEIIYDTPQLYEIYLQAEIYSPIRNCALLELNIFGTSDDVWMKWEVFGTPVPTISNQFHVSFGKRSPSLHIFCDFNFSTDTLMKCHSQTASVSTGIPFTLEQQKYKFFLGWHYLWPAPSHCVC